MDNINNITGYDQQSQISETAESTRVNAHEDRSVRRDNETPGDKVSISDASKEMQAAREAVENVRDETVEAERAIKVEKIKQEIDNGTYEINPGKIAEKMIGSIINEIA